MASSGLNGSALTKQLKIPRSRALEALMKARLISTVLDEVRRGLRESPERCARRT